MLRVFIAMLIFFAGMFAGWIIRGVDIIPVENASPARLLPEKEVIPRNIRTLYAEGSLQEVLELSRGDIALILELMGPATSNRARTRLQIYMATYGEALYGLIRLALMDTSYCNYDSAVAMMEKSSANLFSGGSLPGRLPLFMSVCNSPGTLYGRMPGR